MRTVKTNKTYYVYTEYDFNGKKLYGTIFQTMRGVNKKLGFKLEFKNYNVLNGRINIKFIKPKNKVVVTTSSKYIEVIKVKK